MHDSHDPSFLRSYKLFLQEICLIRMYHVDPADSVSVFVISFPHECPLAWRIGLMIVTIACIVRRPFESHDNPARHNCWARFMAWETHDSDFCCRLRQANFAEQQCFERPRADLISQKCGATSWKTRLSEFEFQWYSFPELLFRKSAPNVPPYQPWIW